MRELQDSFTLKDKGIELHRLQVPSDLDWENEQEVSLHHLASLPDLRMEPCALHPSSETCMFIMQGLNFLCGFPSMKPVFVFQVAERYYPLVEQLLLKATGATRVHIFDHTLRRGHLAK